MITKEKLDELVRTEFTDEITLREWNKKKDNLDPGYYPEYMDGNRIEWIKSNGAIVTYDEELAYFCWKCGCSLSVRYDWYDGSPTCTLWLPETEDEYQKNLKEANEWWKDVMEE